MALILVVKDDIGLREWLSEIMRGAGHEIVAAKDGLEARSFVLRQSFDLVVTDISMPNEEGLGLIRAMQKERPEFKIVVVSGKDPEIRMDARILGAHATLRKPVTAAAVLQCVCELSPTGNGI
jgi:CheY-like chemotaxis protein